jgi:hypothetical protein
VSLDERPRVSTRPTPKVHYNSLPRTSIEGALEGVWQRGRAGVDVSVDPTMYSIDEALESIKVERGEPKGAA